MFSRLELIATTIEWTHCARQADVYGPLDAGTRPTTPAMTWSNPGPGAIRSLCRLLGRELTTKRNATCPPVPRDWEEQTRKLLATMQRDLADLPTFEMRDVEHSLCEYDKYVRLLFNEGKAKRRYSGGA